MIGWLNSASRISSISRPLNGETPTIDLVVLSKMALTNEEQQPKAIPW